MPEPEDERMDALSEAIRRVLERQRELEERLARLEETVHARPPARTKAPAAPRPVPARRAPAAPRFESRVGLTWINRAGVVTLVIGVAFFFKYAVDNRWIGETGRVALGVLAGLAALGLADLLRRRAGQRTFAQGITGAGIAILYVSFYAAFGFYHLLAQPLAFLLMVLNTAAAGALALRYDSAAIAALGLIGGYVTPVLLSTGQDRPWVLFPYLLVLNTGALAGARQRRWRGLTALAFVSTTILYFSWLIEFHRSDRAAAYLFAFVFYAMFAATGSRLLFLAAQLAAVIELAAVAEPDALAFLPLALLVSAAGLALADRRGWREAPLGVFFSFWIPYAVMHESLQRHAAVEIIFSLLTPAFLLFFAWAPFRQLVRHAAACREDLVMVVLNAAFYFGFCYDLLERGYRPWMGLFAVALAALHFGAGRELWGSARRDSRIVLLYVGVALAFLTLAAPVQFAGYRITMAWSLEAAALAWIGVHTGERRLIWTALAVFALAAERLLAVDSWYANPPGYATLWNVRMLAFATAAGALWLSAWWIRRGWPALAVYVAGHFLMLWALVLEVFGWAGRNAAPADMLNVKNTGASILIAAYAVLLVGIGVAARSALNRLLGLGLIAVVVAKLYLYDVWQINRGIYRVAAFAALGIFLLLTSYLYSRYRGSIESWWKDEG